MARIFFLLIAILCGTVLAGQHLLAQTTAPVGSSDSATAKQKRNEEIAREKQEAAKQWPTSNQKALETWAAARQKRRDCQKQASERKLYFTKRSRFLKECLAGKTS